MDGFGRCLLGGWTITGRHCSGLYTCGIAPVGYIMAPQSSDELIGLWSLRHHSTGQPSNSTSNSRNSEDRGPRSSKTTRANMTSIEEGASKRPRSLRRCGETREQLARREQDTTATLKARANGQHDHAPHTTPIPYGMFVILRRLITTRIDATGINIRTHPSWSPVPQPLPRLLRHVCTPVGIC